MMKLGHLVLLLILAARPGIAEVKPLLERREGQEPGLNELRTVMPGEPMYQEFDYPRWLAAQPASDIVYTRAIRFRSDENWLGFDWSGKRMFCGNDEQSTTFGGGRVCVVDDGSDGTFDRFAVWQGNRVTSAVVGIRTGIKPPIPYKRVFGKSFPSEPSEHQPYHG